MPGWITLGNQLTNVNIVDPVIHIPSLMKHLRETGQIQEDKEKVKEVEEREMRRREGGGEEEKEAK